jgi:hypothetical protein
VKTSKYKKEQAKYFVLNYLKPCVKPYLIE